MDSSLLDIIRVVIFMVIVSLFNSYRTGSMKKKKDKFKKKLLKSVDKR